jgi:hypothetical protein
MKNHKPRVAFCIILFSQSILSDYLLISLYLLNIELEDMPKINLRSSRQLYGDASQRRENIRDLDRNTKSIHSFLLPFNHTGHTLKSSPKGEQEPIEFNKGVSDFSTSKIIKEDFETTNDGMQHLPWQLCQTIQLTVDANKLDRSLCRPNPNESSLV